MRRRIFISCCSLLLLLGLAQATVQIVRADPTVEHRYVLRLPNGTTKEIKGAKVHKSTVLKDPAHGGDDTQYGHIVNDVCIYPEQKGHSNSFSVAAPYQCKSSESCHQEDIGAPYLPASFNTAAIVPSGTEKYDASYWGFYKETFTSMLSREAPYLAALYDPTNIRGFSGARWEGKVDHKEGPFEIMTSGTDNPHGSYPLIGTKGWGNVNGYAGAQSWGPGEMYKNDVAGNIVQGQITWTLVAPEEQQLPPPTAGFSSACQNMSCPAVISYVLKLTNIQPTTITSDKTQAGFYLSFYGTGWSSDQKNKVKSFLGTPDFTAGSDFGYYIAKTNQLKNNGGVLSIESLWAGGQTIGVSCGGGCKTLNQLVTWTKAQKDAGTTVPMYSVGASLTIDGGATQNSSVGGAQLSLLPDECSSCSVGSKPTSNLTSEAVACTRTEPTAFNYIISDINLNGNAFSSASFSLAFLNTTDNVKLINFLGSPNEIINSNEFRYTIYRSGVMGSNNKVGFFWDDNTPFAHGKTLSELTTFLKTNGLSPYVVVKGNVEVKTPSGPLINNDSNTGSLNLTSPACPELACPANEQGNANPPVVLQPSNIDHALHITAGNITRISWTQSNPTVRGNVVDAYEVILYKTGAFATPADANAFAKTHPNATNVIRYWIPAHKASPAEYASHYNLDVPLRSEMLENDTLAIRSINNDPIGCAGADDGAGDGNNQPPPTSNPNPSPDPDPNNPPPPWNPDPLPVVAEFSGNIYKSASCNMADATPIVLNGSSNVEVVRSDDNQVFSARLNGSSYTADIPAHPTDYFPKLKLNSNGLTEQLVCSACNPDTGDGFCHRVRTQGPTTTANFFVQSYNLSFDSWWQIRSGLLYGHTAVKSDLPLENGAKNSDCANAGTYCEPYLVRRALSEQDGSAGVPMTNGVFSGITGWWSDHAPSAYTQGTDNKTHAVIENYQYFFNKINPTTADIARNIESLGDVPPGVDMHGTKVSLREGNLVVDPDQTWTIASGEKRIIFVHGDLRISQRANPIIRVTEGGFLAFIVSGNIIFDANIGHENINSTTPNTLIDPNIEGIFIANNNLVFESKGSDDKKFVGAGSYIGWSGVSLRRTFDDGSLGKFRNTTTPAETFIFRPDFIVNAPDELRYSSLVWQEVN